jgi:type IV pilus assembly protein PilN
MIRINLLPVREARRREDLRQYGMQFVLVLLVTIAGIGFAHSRVSDKIDIRQFKPQLDQVAAFRKKKASLEKKIDVIDGLDRARSGPVRVMDELATHTPERLWLNGLATKGRRLELTGESLDNELVAVFLRALGESPHFGKVDLESTELGTANDGLKLVKFKIDAVLINRKRAAKS